MTTFYKPTWFQWAGFALYFVAHWCVFYVMLPDVADLHAIYRMPKLDVAYPMLSLILGLSATATIYCFPRKKWLALTLATFPCVQLIGTFASVFMHASIEEIKSVKTILCTVYAGAHWWVYEKAKNMLEPHLRFMDPYASRSLERDERQLMECNHFASVSYSYQQYVLSMIVWLVIGVDAIWTRHSAHISVVTLIVLQQYMPCFLALCHTVNRRSQRWVAEVA